MEKIICTNGSGSTGGGSSSSSNIQEEVRKGPWTMEEDLILINYIANHGEGNWNTLAKSAGLKRTGKSCRLRWLNYLRPDVRRGNITPEEQLLIMDLHSKWGNRWSKIARQLPGRTDNEIKNFWRTRMQKKPAQGEHFDNQYEPLNQMVMSDHAGTSSINGINEYSNGTQDNYPMNPNVGSVDAFGSNAPDVTADNFWSVEDYWFVQPPNGADH